MTQEEKDKILSALDREDFTQTPLVSSNDQPELEAVTDGVTEETGGGSTSDSTSDSLPDGYTYYDTFHYRGQNVDLYRKNWTRQYYYHWCKWNGQVFSDWGPSWDNIKKSLREAIDKWIEAGGDKKPGTGGDNNPGDDDDDEKDPNGGDDDGKFTSRDWFNMLYDWFTNYFSNTDFDPLKSQDFLTDWIDLFGKLNGDKDPLDGMSASDRREFTTMMWQALYNFKLSQYNNMYSQYTWYLQNEYNSPIAQAKRLAEAGMFNAMSSQVDSGNAGEAAETHESAGTTPYQDESSELELAKRNSLISQVFGGIGTVASLASVAGGLAQLSLLPDQRGLLKSEKALTDQEKLTEEEETNLTATENQDIIWRESFLTKQLDRTYTLGLMKNNTERFKIFTDFNLALRQNQIQENFNNGLLQQQQYQTDMGFRASQLTNATNKSNAELAAQTAYDQFGIQGLIDMLNLNKDEQEYTYYTEKGSNRQHSVEDMRQLYGEAFASGEASAKGSFFGFAKASAGASAGIKGSYTNKHTDGESVSIGGKTYVAHVTKRTSLSPAGIDIINAVAQEARNIPVSALNSQQHTLYRILSSALHNAIGKHINDAPENLAKDYVNGTRELIESTPYGIFKAD